MLQEEERQFVWDNLTDDDRRILLEKIQNIADEIVDIEEIVNKKLGVQIKEICQHVADLRANNVCLGMQLGLSSSDIEKKQKHAKPIILDKRSESEKRMDELK